MRWGALVKEVEGQQRGKCTMRWRVRFKICTWVLLGVCDLEGKRANGGLQTLSKGRG